MIPERCETGKSTSSPLSPQWQPSLVSIIISDGHLCSHILVHIVSYDSAVFGGTLALPAFTRDFGLDTMSESTVDTLEANIVATFHAGCSFGALLTFPLSEKIGRKKAVLSCPWVFLTGAVFMTAAQGHVALIIAGRAVAGIGIGAVSMMVPVYIAETSPPSIRGRLIGLWEICSQGGGMCGFWINYAVNQTISGSNKAQCMVPMGLQLMPGLFLFIGMFFCPESPRWLVKQDNWEAAEKVLSNIRTLPVNHTYIRNELAEI